ncbi:hypothetical protein DFO80_13922 [Rhodobacter sp. 140A]|nr:hypothetical protein DFO80_13922 [Rhodobacter sp. 140A]
MPRRCAQTCDNTLENRGSTIVDIQHRCCIFLRVATDVVERRSPSEGAITPAAAASPEASIPPLPIRSPCRVGLLSGPRRDHGQPWSCHPWGRRAPCCQPVGVGVHRRHRGRRSARGAFLEGGAGIKDAICATRLCCPFGAAGIRRAGQFLLAAAGAWASGAPRHRQAARGARGLRLTAGISGTARVPARTAPRRSPRARRTAARPPQTRRRGTGLTATT